MRPTASFICLMLLVQSVVGGCSSSRVQTSTSPTSVTRRDSTVRAVPSIGWSPEMKPGKWHYIIHDSSIISITNDSNAQARPIESTTSYTVTVTDSANLLVLNVHMDSMTVTSQRSTPRTISDTAHAQFRTVISKQNHLISPLQQLTTCTTASSPQTVRLGELLIPLPITHVNARDKWTDSSATIVCHGRVMLTESRITEYELTDSISCKQSDAVAIHRTVSSTFTGSSAEGNSHLSAGGSGTGSAILCLERSTGLLLTSSGESRLDLTATTSRGVFPFTQKTTTDIQIR